MLLTKLALSKQNVLNMIILFLFFVVVFSRYMILIKNISLDISSGRVQDQNETCQCAVFFLPFWVFCSHNAMGC